MISYRMNENWKSRLLKAADEDPRSDRAISLAVGLGVNTVNELRNTNKSPSIDKVMKLAEELGLSLSYVFSGDEPDAQPIRGEKQILAMLKRIEGLNDQDVSIALSVILNAIRVNASSQSPIQQHDQLVPATPPHGSKPSSQR